MTPWAKVDRATRRAHLLPHHLLDVAACTLAFVDRRAGGHAALAQMLGVPGDQARVVAAWLAALHDLGKLHPTFQGLAPDVATRLGAQQAQGYHVRHDSLGSLLFDAGLRRHLANRFSRAPPDEEDWNEWFRDVVPAVAGHHGMPPVRAANGALLRPSDYWPQPLVSQACALADELAEVIGVRLPLGPAAPPVERRLTWSLAGLITLADWLGSDSAHFPFCEERIPLAEYWAKRARPQAERALDASGLGRASVRAEGNFATLFPGREPTPLQRAAADVPLHPGPTLYILEDQTGSGKTEAALVLAQRLMRTWDSLYFALPTMATSDMMYARLAPLVPRLLHDGQATFVIAHAEGLRRMEDDAAPTLTAWMRDSRKKAFLAQLGVGTIDQALLGVLPIRHQSLRLFALADRVLIIDEVHAYDEYVNHLLLELLTHQLALGNSVILLSATIPADLRRRLISLVGAPTSEMTDAYPALTRATPGELATFPVEPRQGIERQVAVRTYTTEDEVVARILDASQSGSCVAWIRNTVQDALDAHERLRAAGAIVYHSRFTSGDRRIREQDLVAWAGPEGVPEQRAGRIVVATQVLEQSLDLDFDVLISDLAPMESLLQRLGRVQRHARGERAPPLLEIYTPPLTPDPGPTWYSSLFPRAAHVYADHEMLWRTQVHLAERGSFELPRDARELVDAAYDPTKRAPGLAEATRDAATERAVRASAAMLKALPLSSGYRATDHPWQDDGDARTRYGDRTRDAWLCYEDDGHLRPLPSTHSWDDARLRAPGHAVKPTPDLEERAPGVMPDQGRRSALVVLRKIDGGWHGATPGGASLSYSFERGLEIHGEDER